jgi:hypothetical protein
MATNVQTPPRGPSVVDTITGIVHDLETLLKQQFAMYQAEARVDWEKTKSALWPLITGGVVLLAGMIMFCFMLVHLIHWLASPPTEDMAQIPLWACFALVGLVFTLVGGVLAYLGIQRFHTFNPLPVQSNQALKENVQWLTHPK